MKTQLITSALRFRRTAFTALAMSAMAVASAHANLVTDGSFGTTGGSGQIGFESYNISPWTNVTVTNGAAAANAYNFLYSAGAPTAFGQYGSVTMAGSEPPRLNGGNFVALDGDFNTSGGTTGVAIGQTIGGLTATDQYTVSFYMAAAQQTGFSGSTTEQLQVGLGSQLIDTTPVISLGPQGNPTWSSLITLTFTATSSSEVLSFLAIGTPANQPTFALLDGVDMEQVTSGPPPTTPEPGSLTLLSTGLLGLAGFLRSRYKKAAVSL